MTRKNYDYSGIKIKFGLTGFDWFNFRFFYF